MDRTPQYHRIRSPRSLTTGWEPGSEPRLAVAANGGEHIGYVWVYKLTEPRVYLGLRIPIGNMLRWLQPWNNPRPRPMVTYDKGLPSLPYDIINEIFSLLDMEALKSCSLAGKVLSCSAKPLIHRTLHLTSKSGGAALFNIPTGRRNKLRELPAPGERGLLRHTHHLSIAFPHDPVSVHNLRPRTQHLRALTNLKSFKTHWLDIPLFTPKVKEYFGAFLGTLQSLELEYPMGDYQQILWLVFKFPNLRDLRVVSVRGLPSYTRNWGFRFDVKTSPPLDGTLDLQLDLQSEMETGPGCGSMGAQLFLSNLVAFP